MAKSDRDDAPIGPVVVVTGASSGIGRETALRYAQRKASLVLAARSACPLRHVAEACLTAGATAVAVQPTDVADQDQVNTLLETASERFGRVDIVVHSAAVTAFGRFAELPQEVFDAVVHTNLCGTANVARSALAQFTAQDAGQLVLVGSLLGKAAFPYQSGYVASKFGVSGLVRLLRQEYRDRPRITVHGIYPGPVDTPIYGNAANYFGQRARPLPPTYQPASIATTILRATDRARSSEHNAHWIALPMLALYRFLPPLFDAVAEPFVRLAGFFRQSVSPTTGNVLSPTPADIPQRTPDVVTRS